MLRGVAWQPQEMRFLFVLSSQDTKEAAVGEKCGTRLIQFSMWVISLSSSLESGLNRIQVLSMLLVTWLSVHNFH